MPLRTLIRRSAALALIAAPLAVRAQLSPPERAVAAAVDRRNAEALALLERIVNINRVR